jgi:hypothetical protein
MYINSRIIQTKQKKILPFLFLITECHNITEMFLKVALNTIKQINKRPLKFGHPSRSLSKVKYINICNGPPICHEVEHFVQIG